MSPKADISVILITHNEHKNLKDCIASVDFCREIIVVDHASTDGTVELARSLGCNVIQTPDWPGFGKQKQRALEAATCGWVFSIDADERVTPELKEALLRAVAEGESNGYQVNRQSFFLGHAMRFGGWSPDWITRLVRREHARFDGAVVHESLHVTGAIGRLSGLLLHYSYPTMEDVLRKQMTYALLGAAKKRDQGASYGVGVAFVAALVVFVRVLVFKLGLLDGRFGWLAAFARAQETFWKYAATRYLGPR